MDITKLVAESRTFYREHNLRAWADELPGKPVLGPDSTAVLEYAARCGFDRGFAFPAFARQLADLDVLIEETLRKPARGLPDDQQYTKTYISDNWDKDPNGQVVQRTDELGPRLDGTYLLLFSTMAEKAAFAKTGKQMVAHFESKNWTGLTVPEYLVLQRWLCEQHRDHRFFATPLDESRMHWLWLTDSATASACAAAVGSSRGAMIYGCKIGTRDARRGAVPTLIAPIGR